MITTFSCGCNPSQYIDRLEKDATGTSCKDDLLARISSHIDQFENDFSTYSERHNDFSLVAKSMVNTDSFELIESGKYHIHGILNLLNSPAKNLIHVHKVAVKDALDSGLITQEEYEEDLLALQEAITSRL